MEPNHLVQSIGAGLIVGAYVLLQAGKLRSTSLTFSAVNFLGAGILSVELTRTQQWGLLALEGTWTIVSAWGCYRALRPRPPEPTNGEPTNTELRDTEPRE